ncbi:MAG: WG repeat-containing protein [Myxococcota bacterium]
MGGSYRSRWCVLGVLVGVGLGEPTAAAGSYGYIDTSGTMVISPQFYSASGFKHGLAPVRNDARRYGYVDPTGRLAVDFTLAKAERLSSPKVAFAKFPGESSYVLITRSGRRVGTRTFARRLFFSEGLAAFEEGERCGYLNERGETVIEAVYFGCRAFQHGLARVGKGERYGFVGPMGTVEIPFSFQEAEAYREQDGAVVARVKQGGKSGLIDVAGAFVMPPVYGTVGVYGDGLFPAKLTGGRWGYIDDANQVVVPGTYTWASTCHHERCAVENKGQHGFIDPSGAVVIPLIYDSVSNFDGPYARVTRQGSDSFIGVDGQPFTTEDVDWLGIAADGRVPYRDRRTGRYGYLSEDGTVAIAATYCRVDPFSEGLAAVKVCTD